MKQRAFRAWGTASILLGLIGLQGCGGGGDNRTEPAHAAADATSRSSELPTAYLAVFTDVFAGGAGDPAYSVVDASRGRVIDAQGRFAATYGAPVGAPQAILAPPVQRMSSFEDRSFASGVSPNGIFIGTSYSLEQVNRAFATFTQTAQTYYTPAVSSADFVSTTGLVGGHACADGEGQPQSCGGDLRPFAVHWQPVTGELSPHPGFLAAWMNDGGRMLGYQELPDGTKRLSTVGPDGVVADLSFEPEAGFTAVPRFISDDGAVFLNVADDPFNPRREMAVVLIDSCVAVTVGRVAERPALCNTTECVERTRFTAFSATGHAVGEHAWLYRDEDGNWQFAVEVGFHWSEKDGSTAITDAGEGLPFGVNAHGAVIVGGPAVRTPSSQNGRAEPFLWQKGAGAMALRTTLFPDPGELQPEDVLEVLAIGDGGELLVWFGNPADLQSWLRLFTPAKGS